MKASQLICHQLQLLKYFTNAWVLPKWAVCGKHPIFRVPWQGLPHGFCELMFCCRWRSHLRLILKKQRSRFKSFVLFWMPSCPDGGLPTIFTVVSFLLPRLAMHSSFFSLIAIPPVVIISLHTVYTFRFLHIFAEFDVLFESSCDSLCNIWPNLDILPTPTIATGTSQTTTTKLV